MQTKNIVIIGSLTVLGLFWIVAPALMKDKVVGFVNFTSVDRQCFNYYKNEEDYFKDPDSAYIENSRILTKKDNATELSQYPLVLEDAAYDSVVRIKVRARNGMGGYVSDDIYCPLENSEFNKWTQALYIIKVADRESTIKLCAKALASSVHSLDVDNWVKKNCSNQ